MNEILWIFLKATKSVTTGMYSFYGKINNNMISKILRSSESDERSIILCKGIFVKDNTPYNYTITSDGYGKYRVTFQIKFTSENHYQKVKKEWLLNTIK